MNDFRLALVVLGIELINSEFFGSFDCVRAVTEEGMSAFVIVVG